MPTTQWILVLGAGVVAVKKIDEVPVLKLPFVCVCVCVCVCVRACTYMYDKQTNSQNVSSDDKCYGKK